MLSWLINLSLSLSCYTGKNQVPKSWTNVRKLGNHALFFSWCRVLWKLVHDFGNWFFSVYSTGFRSIFLKNPRLSLLNWLRIFAGANQPEMCVWNSFQMCKNNPGAAGLNVRSWRKPWLLTMHHQRRLPAVQRFEFSACSHDSHVAHFSSIMKHNYRDCIMHLFF